MLKIPLVVLLFATLLVMGCGPKQTSQNQITVAAAADLAPAFEELGRIFERQHSAKVVFSFGSTGMLTQQIENGAPMDLFAAANVDFINRLEKDARRVDIRRLRLAKR